MVHCVQSEQELLSFNITLATESFHKLLHLEKPSDAAALTSYDQICYKALPRG